MIDYAFRMIHEPDLVALESRARAARTTMRQVCKSAGVHPQSWYRARKRGRMEYRLYDPLMDALVLAELARAEHLS